MKTYKISENELVGSLIYGIIFLCAWTTLVWWASWISSQTYCPETLCNESGSYYDIDEINGNETIENNFTEDGELFIKLECDANTMD